MRLHSKSALLAVFWLALPLLSWSASAPADEAAAGRLWQFHQQKTSDHAAVVKACVAFEKQYPQSPLITLSHGLAGWHLLKMEQPRAAAPLFETMISDNPASPLAEAGNTMARRWMTRLDREKVREALRRYYSHNIEFPAVVDKLDKLPADQRPPMTDRWKNTWVYRLTGFKRVGGLFDQKYLLQSAALTTDSDFKEALAKPYPAESGLKPLRYVSREAGKRSVQFAAGAEQILLSEGTKQGPWIFAYAGETLLVLCDGDHWLLLPSPT